MTGCVIDASAILCLLLDEPGADKVAAALPEGVLSAVNIAEVVGYYARRGAPAADIRRLLDGLSLTVEPFGAEDAHLAGAMLPVVQPFGLSLGDRACLALARRLRLPAVTADRAWAAVADAVSVRIALVR